MPAAGRGEVGFEERRDVRTEERHPVAFFEVGVVQSARESVHAPLELAVGAAAFAVDDGGMVGEHI